MEYYSLKEDEVVLYKGDVYLKGKSKSTQLVLTNLNLVFITKNSPFLSDERIERQIYPVSDVKIYEGVPQVKVESTDVVVYLKTTEVEFEFQSKSELIKFRSAIVKLLTGKTGFERGADNVKNKIVVVNDTFGVDVVKTTQDAVKSGILESIGGVFGKMGKIGKSILGKKK